MDLSNRLAPTITVIAIASSAITSQRNRVATRPAEPPEPSFHRPPPSPPPPRAARPARPPGAPLQGPRRVGGAGAPGGHGASERDAREDGRRAHRQHAKAPLWRPEAEQDHLIRHRAREQPYSPRREDRPGHGPQQREQRYLDDHFPRDHAARRAEGQAQESGR